MIINVEQYFGKNVTVNLIEILGCILFVIAWPLKYDINTSQPGTMIAENTETDSYRFTFSLWTLFRRSKTINYFLILMFFKNFDEYIILLLYSWTRWCFFFQ